jgi:hypothetical protein
MSVGGDMMVLSQVRPKYNNLVEKNGKGNNNKFPPLFDVNLTALFRCMCFICIREITYGRVCP